MILITGATGNIGSELVQQLSARGAPLRIVTRDERKVAHLDARIERVIGNLSERDTVQRAVRGVERLFMVTLLTGEGDTADPMLIEEARKAGVRHVVKVSSLGTAGKSRMGQMHREKEQLIEASGMGWTFLRPGSFMSNALQWVGPIRAQGKVFTPTADGKVAPIDPKDIAAVAAVALTSSGHEGQVHELTGPELLSAHDQVRILAGILGRTLQCVDVPVTVAGENVRKSGAPDWMVEGLMELWTAIRSGNGGILKDGVQRVTGRPARTFEQWCQEHRGAFS
ncbi:SDR family oxidoreductase [Pyxidicoccus parkwayensis]|uniref:SDR family oxidoreductase n=1 Tax=Pyxidicoccus parkwayensis TaxID=2813578 RepID=A0ABX7NQ58_9BACT|nr:SDR family oxidoreductase [Pyxidicoccus parkwaysis]QSQ19531.1 SDR family oxidoreductase [Pyxidicoccus parkwaysis]